MAAIITAHNLECYIVSDSYVPIVLDVTIVLDSPTYYAYLFTLQFRTSFLHRIWLI